MIQNIAIDMASKVPHVKNPLSIIALFAGFTEIGGTVVLPMLEPDIQGKYVWFLMAFPSCLVAVFFFVLYTKYKVLYAPSDYRSDETFKELVQGQAKAEDVQGQGTAGAPVDAAQQERPSSEELSFAALDESERKVLTTLWRFQKEAFPNDEKQRWGFGVALGSQEYFQFRKGAESLAQKHFVSIAPTGLCFLTDTGLNYCNSESLNIAKEKSYWSNFSN